MYLQIIIKDIIIKINLYTTSIIDTDRTAELYIYLEYMIFK